MLRINMRFNLAVHLPLRWIAAALVLPFQIGQEVFSGGRGHRKSILGEAGKRCMRSINLGAQHGGHPKSGMNRFGCLFGRLGRIRQLIPRDMQSQEIG